MTFILPSDVVAGEATKASSFNAVNDALADLNSRVTGISGTVLANGSFEIDDGASVPEPSNWTVTDFSGGSHSLDVANVYHGEQSLKMTTTAADGRVEALSDDFIAVAENDIVQVLGYVDSDTADIRTRVQVLFYDVDEVLVDTDTAYDEEDTGLSWTMFRGWSGRAPSTAAFFKIKLLGGDAASSTVAGNINFDGVSIRVSPFFTNYIVDAFIVSDTFVVPPATDYIYAVCVGAAGGGGGARAGGGDRASGGGGGGGGVIEGWLGVTPGETLTITVGTGGAGGAGGAFGGDGADGGDTLIVDSGAVTIMEVLGGLLGGGGGNGFVGGSGGAGGQTTNALQALLFKTTNGGGGTGSSGGGDQDGGDGGQATTLRGAAGIGGPGIGGTNGGDGGAPGGGGGGAGSSAPGAAGTGGDGADGAVIIFY